MSLVLYQHPFAAYCQKVLAALYELGLPFESRLVEGEEGRVELARLWGMATIPVLRDDAADLTLPESTTIIEHLDGLAGAGGRSLIPGDPAAALQARLWDRFADHHLATPMQKIVADELRPEGGRDPVGVAEARTALDTAYGVLDARLAESAWAGGDAFTVADCAAFPPLFFLRAIHRWEHVHVARYYRDLLARPSVARVVDEARPFRELFPLPWPADQDAPGRPTLYEFAGGDPALLALAEAHHVRCLADPELNHPFSHPGQHPQHVQRLAAYWAEVLGGPPAFSQACNDQSALLQMHAGNGDMSDLGERFKACFSLAMDDAGLPSDPRFRAAMNAYMAWAVDDVLAYSPVGTVVAPGAPMPRWGWDGLE